MWFVLKAIDVRLQNVSSGASRIPNPIPAFFSFIKMGPKIIWAEAAIIEVWKVLPNSHINALDASLCWPDANQKLSFFWSWIYVNRKGNFSALKCSLFVNAQSNIVCMLRERMWEAWSLKFTFFCKNSKLLSARTDLINFTVHLVHEGQNIFEKSIKVW